MWTHRVMIGGLVRRDLHARYAGSTLGVAWTFVHPLLLLLVYWFVFSSILQVKFTESGSNSDFVFYLLAGLLPWLAFQEGVTKAASSLVEYAGLVKAVRFPTAVLVASSVLASSITFLLSLGVLLVGLMISGRLHWTGLAFIPLLLSLQTILAFGFGLIVASLYPFLRDTLPVLQMIFMVWFYLTPVIYPLSYVPSHLVPYFLWNPLVPLVTAYRTVLLEGAMPSGVDLLPVGAWMVTMMSLGSVIFSRVEPGFAEVL
jgi:ABC-type polysaccharide/polyol phosphate export permease